MRLRYKLSMLFLMVIAIGTATTFVLVRRSTESVFRSFIFQGDAEKAVAYAGILAEYRLQNGGWGGIQSFLEELPALFAHTIEARLDEPAGQGFVEGYPAAFRPLLADRVVVADSSGVIVADTAGLVTGTMHPSRHLVHGAVILAGTELQGTVLVGSMVDSSLAGDDERFLNSVTGSLAWSTAISAVLALFLGVIFATGITRPIRALSLAAEAVASGGAWPVPVPISGRDEITELSKSFNVMTAEIGRLDAARKRAIADSAHELRTPVTLIQGLVEGMIDGVFPRDARTLESVHEETLRLARLIDTLRELEIIESGELKLALEGVDVREVLQRAVSSFAAAAGSKSIRLAADDRSPSASVARGDRLRLDEVVYNLLSNAVKFCPSGGEIRARILPGDAGFAEFSVDDSGPGIPIAERGHVFERYYRLDASRSAGTGGSGLGLAIAYEIVKAHGGSVSIGDSDLGGASFVVRIPAMPPTG